VVYDWELGTDQTDSPRYMRWMGVGTNCSAPPAKPHGLGSTCFYAPFWGAMDNERGKYRHTSGGGNVEEVTVYGDWMSWDGLFMEAGPFQILSFTPDAGREDAYANWWGQVGGTWQRDRCLFPGVGKGGGGGGDTRDI
jgi:hypothetical protein